MKLIRNISKKSHHWTSIFIHAVVFWSSRSFPFIFSLTHSPYLTYTITHTHTHTLHINADNISFSYTHASITLVLSLFTIHGHDQGHNIMEVYLLYEKPVSSYTECLITTMLVLFGYYFTKMLYSTQAI